jgi:hypothetical protein
MVKKSDSFDYSFSSEYSDLPPNSKLLELGDLFVVMKCGLGVLFTYHVRFLLDNVPDG